MHRRVVLSLAILFAVASVASAAPIIDVGLLHPVSDTGTTFIDVFVSDPENDDPIGAIDMLISTGNEDTAGAPGEPKIVTIDVVTGTIYAGNSGNAAPGQVLFTSDDIWQIDNITAAGTVNANGKIFTIEIDPNGAPIGSVWALRVFTSFGDSNYSNTTVLGVPFAGNNGTFEIIPEPTSVALGLFALAGFGAVAIRRRRRRA